MKRGSKVTQQSTELIEIHDLSEIPDFADEDEEAAYWGTHMFSIDLLLSLPPDDEPLPPPRDRGSKRVRG